MSFGRGLRHDSEVLIRQIDTRLATLRVGAGADEALAENIAGVLRQMVVDTTWASAADRARVRAAVHFFVVRRDGRSERRPSRAISEDVRVVNEIARDLGRHDLAVDAGPARRGGLAPARNRGSTLVPILR